MIPTPLMNCFGVTEEGARAMQGEEMKDIAHDVVCKKKRYEVGGCEGDNANVGGGGIYT